MRQLESSFSISNVQVAQDVNLLINPIGAAAAGGVGGTHKLIIKKRSLII